MPKRLAILGLAAVLLLGICTMVLGVDCEQLKSPPQVPVYPGSTLSRQSLHGIGSRSSIADNYYTSPDVPEKIVAFYTEKGYCGVGEPVSGRESCHGVAVPFGEYFAHIDLESYASQGVTSYVIEIFWEGCGDFD